MVKKGLNQNPKRFEAPTRDLPALKKPQEAKLLSPVRKLEHFSASRASIGTWRLRIERRAAGGLIEPSPPLPQTLLPLSAVLVIRSPSLPISRHHTIGREVSCAWEELTKCRSPGE
jgi:hypothetical protein